MGDPALAKVLTYPGIKDRPRKRPMVRVRVENTVEGLTVPHANMLGKGLCEFTCYDDELPIIEALVEREPESIKLAESAFRASIERQADDNLKGTHASAEDREVEIARLMQTTGESREMHFRRLKNRDILPLRGDVEVLEMDLPEPKAEEMAEATNANARAIARAIAAEMGGAELRAELDALRAEIEELRALKKKG